MTFLRALTAATIAIGVATCPAWAQAPAPTPARAAALSRYAPVPLVIQGPGSVVTVKQGAVRGAMVEGTEMFLGLPFAAPPVGDLRWTPPRPAASWTGERDGSKLGGECQRVEDCLYLNVTRPAGVKPGAKLPVYVWIHGGGFTIGAPNAAFGAETDGVQFAREGIITVSVAYRVGRAGYFSHPALSREGNLGNFGVMDQVAALKWVQANIAAFGGDPKNVTIGGESAGGISVLYLMLSPPARGLFQKAIGESSFGRSVPWTREAAEASGIQAATKAGVTGSDAAAAAALRKLPLSAMPYGGEFAGRANAMVDGKYVMAGSYVDQFAARRQAKIPLLIGGNSNEASLYRPTEAELGKLTPERAKSLIAAYDPAGGASRLKIANDMVTRERITEPDRAISRIHAKAGAPVYLYYFSYVTPARRATALGAAHTDELKYAWAGPRQRFTPEDLPLAKAVSAYWTSFIKTGDPDSAGGPAWPKFTLAGEGSMEFGAEGPQVRDHHLKAQLDWTEAGIK